ncbi:MAG: phosphate acyltransferase PlsX [Pseudomonadota bacterium]
MPSKPNMLISVDAMGGDLGPSVVVAGLSQSARKNSKIGFILHGDADQLRPLVAKRKDLTDICEIRDAKDVIAMEDKPSQALRQGRDSSMWSAIESVRNGEASVCVSCGNTGALMLMSVMRLRKLPGIYRPAIAVLWPSANPQGFNIMLDGGADIRADAKDLMQYALMGASYARNGFGLKRPRIGLLNVGTEEHKGRTELKEAHDLISSNARQGDFEFVGFVEGRDLPGTICDVIVTDGFTGNVALKTGEGIANMIISFLREAFRYTPLSRLASVLAYTSLRRMGKRIDPRRSNGGVFLGLNGTVVKSHGAADATGISAAVKLAFELAEKGFTEKLAARVASAAMLKEDEVHEAEPSGERK